MAIFSGVFTDKYADDVINQMARAWYVYFVGTESPHDFDGESLDYSPGKEAGKAYA
jgi:hypothetical protein